MVTTPEAPKRILSMDDDPVMRRLLQVGLTKAGYEPLVAPNGEQAMRLFESNPIDVILVDLIMPVVDGLNFLRWLRQDAKSTVPAFVFTSSISPEILQAARKHGATDVLCKPLRMEVLVNRLGELWPK